jgi:acyl CoA:acetate/3-ketoacid CoA transferase beta subunit
VKRIITDLAIIDVESTGLLVQAKPQDVDMEEIRLKTAAKFRSPLKLQAEVERILKI